MNRGEIIWDGEISEMIDDAASVQRRLLVHLLSPSLRDERQMAVFAVIVTIIAGPLPMHVRHIAG